MRGAGCGVRGSCGHLIQLNLPANLPAKLQDILRRGLVGVNLRQLQRREIDGSVDSPVKCGPKVEQVLIIIKVLIGSCDNLCLDSQ